MPASALSPRLARHATGPGRGSTAVRRPSEPALTVTVAIPLTGDSISPQAHKLIEAVRELVEVSQGTVQLEPAVAPVAEPEPDVAAGPEVRLLTGTRQVIVDGEPLPLTRLEFDLLLFLAERPRRVFTRAQLLTGVWGYDHTGERTVDVHVRRLRLKLGGAVPLITTVYGVGYRLSDDAHVLIKPNE
ncbi:winged helix-turn-helix domain-containing protein [Paractinoplanes lichenicola]|uniref:Winged helix-turn-helix transcriptional regulator n=1 Tax=Paractinoplanes lichenicola TaxID=2802976 RepID=A0ABS1VX83_9ACTN|nr:winged helix-turn-helix domain-containing protein [Actinoplanes lichenicola]MBL7259097.1 winged helix-turn-helix transcriptional regulator [Actinoplanes lichenicola]